MSEEEIGTASKQEVIVTEAQRLGRIKRGVDLQPISPLYEILSRCNDCAVRFVCKSFVNEARCLFEIEALRARKQKLNAFTSGRSEDALADLQVTIRKLEEAISYDTTPSVKDLKDLAYMKMQVFRLAHPTGPQIAVQTNVGVSVGNPTTMDVKALMKELRAKEGDNVKETSVP